MGVGGGGGGGRGRIDCAWKRRGEEDAKKEKRQVDKKANERIAWCNSKRAERVPNTSTSRLSDTNTGIETRWKGRMGCMVHTEY